VALTQTFCTVGSRIAWCWQPFQRKFELSNANRPKSFGGRRDSQSQDRN